MPGRAFGICATAWLALTLCTPAAAAAQYTAYVDIVEGSIRCRQGLLWPYTGPLLSYEAWLKDPRNNTVGNQDRSTYSQRLDGEYSVEPQTSGTYICYASFSADGFYLETKQDAKFINNCGDERGVIIKEYHDTGVAFTPTCDSFTQSVPGASHYSFGQWNSGSFSWALLETSVTSNTYCVVNNYGSTPSFSSGYRNPVHNLAVGGALNSRHVHGDAVDLHTPASPDDTAYNTLRYLAKQVGCGVACVEPRSISPAHYHGDYRGGCPHWVVREGGHFMLPTLEFAIYVSLILSQASLSGNTLANLRSDTVQSRMAAVIETERQVAADPDLLRDVVVQDALVALLERENAVVAANYKTFLATRRSALDETYAEHYARALGLTDQMRKEARPQDEQLLNRLRRALVTGSYNPDSPFAAGLASEGEAIVPVVLEMTESRMSEAKWNAFSLIGQMFSLHESRGLKTPLSTESQRSMRQAARAGLLDPAADVRIWAISAVVGAQDRESIPLLTLMASTDPDGADGMSKYSVRSVAAAALKQIR